MSTDNDGIVTDGHASASGSASWLRSVTQFTDVPARLLMAMLFLFSGFGKLTMVAASQGYMEANGVSGTLIWPAAALEIGGGALLLLGLWIRPLSMLLAGWCLLTATLFHTKFADSEQMIMFLKNMSMAGGFLALAQAGSSNLSLDRLFAKRH